MSGFVDESGLHVKGGDGGAGAVAFRREAHVDKGGPDGGDGGKGGDVWLVADRNTASLLAFRDHPHRRAGNGVHGSGKKRHGAGGDDTVVPVPEGTVVRHHDDGSVLADLVHTGDRWLAAAGGRGGRGNARFLSNRRRAPAFAEQGEAGEERWLRLELKLLADVALVGFPNVGKSTLIAAISAAKPKIADYPFTTLTPNLGVVGLSGDRSFVAADVPGLIEGAHEGLGLGHRFLSHLERTRVLIHVVDVSSSTARDPVDDFDTITRELALFPGRDSAGERLQDKPVVVAANKIDALDEPDRLDRLRAHLQEKGIPLYPVSAATGDGLPLLLEAAWKKLAEARTATNE